MNKQIHKYEPWKSIRIRDNKNKVNWYWFVKLFNVITITTFMGIGMFQFTKIGGLIMSIMGGIWLYISLNK